MSVSAHRRDEHDRPLLFISHRHADRAIADVVREFVTERSGGNVSVFQSSSSEAQAPKIGQNVNRELLKALWKSDLLLLIYTGEERGWDYCMWECGVATHAESEVTRVIVFQCGHRAPPVFSDKLGVDVRDPEQVTRFVNEFLTNAGFFPGGKTPVTRFQPNDANVRRAADEFLAQLRAVIPPDIEDEQVEEWPAVPYMRLELSASQVRQIVVEEDDERARSLTASVLLDAVVVDSDREAAVLFDRPTLPADVPFGHLLPSAARKGNPPAWLRNLAAQVTRAVQWNFPAVSWSLMRSANEHDARYYSPVLTHVRRFPGHAMQFDIHFQRFACPVGAPAVTLPLPENGAEPLPTTV
jgi:TIR domain